MTSYISYRDIPKGERKRLAKEALRLPRIRAIWIPSFFVILLVAGLITDRIVPRQAMLAHLVVDVAIAMTLYAICYALLIGPRLKIEIEKLRNA